MGIVIIVTNWITFASVKERYTRDEEEEEPGFIEGFRIAFSNRPFVMVTCHLPHVLVSYSIYPGQYVTICSVLDWG